MNPKTLILILLILPFQLFAQSIDYYRRAVDLSPKDLSLKGKLGRAYISNDDFVLAYQTFEDIHKVDSTNADYALTRIIKIRKICLSRINDHLLENSSFPPFRMSSCFSTN